MKAYSKDLRQKIVDAIQQVTVKLNRGTMSTIAFAQEVFSGEKHARTVQAGQ